MIEYMNVMFRRIDRCNRNEMSVLVEFKDEAVWFIRFFLSIREDIIL